VAFRDHFIDDEGYLSIVTEHCRFGDLEQLIGTRAAAQRPLASRDVVWLSFQLLCAVRHLHRHSVLHRDLKPGNVFLVPGDPGAPSSGVDHQPSPLDACEVPDDLSAVTLKVADFGISRVLSHTKSVAQTVVGTPYYIAPELVEAQPYGAAADMWAVGCIVYELCALQRLFAGTNMLAVVRAISACAVPPLPPPFEPLNALVGALVRPDPGARATADECLQRFFPAPGITHRVGVNEEL
jgi:serine/threonine protein kinase